MIFAPPIAWLLNRSNLYGGKTLDQLLTSAYVIPPYLLAVAWVTLANPSVGWINQLVPGSSGEGIINIYGIWGIVFIESSALFSILYLTFKTSLRSLDPSLEEASILSGAGPVKTLFLITYPVLKNSLFLGSLSIALATLASFGIPAMIGGPAREYVVTTALYRLMRQGSYESLNEVFVASLIFSGVVILIVLVTKLFLQKKKGQLGARAHLASKWDLGRWNLPLSIALWGLWALILGMPIVVLVFSSFQTDPSQFSFSSLGLDAWKRVFFEVPGFKSAVFTSISASAIAASLVVAFSFVHALLKWSQHKKGTRALYTILRAIEESFFVFYSLPGTVLALLILVFSSYFSTLNLSNTLAILVFAYALKYTSLGLSNLGPATLNVHPSLIEAAELAGAKTFSRLRHIWIPLLRASLFTSFILVLMPCLSELSMSTLLYGPGTQNLGVLLFESQEYADRAAAAVIGTLLLVSVLIFNFFVGKLKNEH